jgi:hypothetical protein
MKNMLVLSFAFLSLSALAHELPEDKIAYPSFTAAEKRYVFVDFKSAHYHVKYDVSKKETSYEATIKFESKEEGHILFDVINNPSSIVVDGTSVESSMIQSPGKETQFRTISKSLKAGEHEMKVKGLINKLVTYEANTGVRSAFWLNDLYDRSYLEQYFPSSFEYDRVAMKFEIEIIGSSKEHVVLANGKQKSLKQNHFMIEFPQNYITSSPFFHMMPEDRFFGERFEMKSIDGRTIPVAIYYSLNEGQSQSDGNRNTIKRHRTTLEAKFAELEKDFGKFLHDQVIVYATEGGGFPGIAGMEYCGATMTNLSALTHELTHSYFGRGVMPANGNAGWIDEAITTWAADGYDLNPSTSIASPAHMFGKGSHIRITHRGAYNEGAYFISQVANEVKTKGHALFTSFLADIIEKKKFEPYSNTDFWNWSKEFYGFNLLELVNSKENSEKSIYSHKKNNSHVRFTDQQLQDLL